MRFILGGVMSFALLAACSGSAPESMAATATSDPATTTAALEPTMTTATRAPVTTDEREQLVAVTERPQNIVAFASIFVGWLEGDLVTSADGTEWQLLEGAPIVSPTSMLSGSAERLLALDGFVLHSTTDGGSWETTQISEADDRLTQRFLNPHNGAVALLAPDGNAPPVPTEQDRAFYRDLLGDDLANEICVVKTSFESKAVAEFLDCDGALLTSVSEDRGFAPTGFAQSPEFRALTAASAPLPQTRLINFDGAAASETLLSYLYDRRDLVPLDDGVASLVVGVVPELMLNDTSASPTQLAKWTAEAGWVQGAQVAGRNSDLRYVVDRTPALTVGGGGELLLVHRDGIDVVDPRDLSRTSVLGLPASSVDSLRVSADGDWAIAVEGVGERAWLAPIAGEWQPISLPEQVYPDLIAVVDGVALIADGEAPGQRLWSYLLE